MIFLLILFMSKHEEDKVGIAISNLLLFINDYIQFLSHVYVSYIET